MATVSTEVAIWPICCFFKAVACYIADLSRTVKYFKKMLRNFHITVGTFFSGIQSSGHQLVYRVHIHSPICV